MIKRQEGEIILGGQRYKYSLRRNKRAKRLIIKVSQMGDITVIMPWSGATRVAAEFVRSKSDWLAKAIKVQQAKKASPLVELRGGAWLPILGDVKQLRIEVDQHRQRSTYKEKGNVLAVTVARTGAVRETVIRWYRVRAEKYVKVQADRLANQIGVGLKKMVMSSARTQWGSCIKGKGRISIQWRLAQAPLGVLNYVIAHEVLHLKFGGHGKDFWDGVSTVCPDYKERRRWLREKGQSLYW